MSADNTDITLQDTLAAAFQALLDNKKDERDKLCAMAEKCFVDNGNPESLPHDTLISLNNKGKQ